MKDTELAYLAGFFDGEGTIYIQKHNKKNKFHMRLEVSITNTSYEVVSLFCVLGHSHHSIYSNKTIPNSRLIHRIRFSGIDTIKKVLVAIYPYLFLKKRHAELIIRFCNIHKKYSRILTTEELAIYTELKKLNKRGI